jgi:hypothetical protein
MKMYDAGKIIFGLVVFLVLITSPIWYNAASGQGSYAPDPKIVTSEKECVAPAEYMKSMHMDLLNEWRDHVVRDGVRIYESYNGKKYDMSLSNTCMECHHNKADFCDSCHHYAGIDPYCWNCHVEPKEI